MSGSVCYEPIPPPTRSPQAGEGRVNLTAEQRDLVTTLLGHFSRDKYTIPGVEGGELLDDEKMWLSYECAQRFLRAVNWQPTNAIARLESTLKWRREWGIYSDLRNPDVAKDARSGGAFVFGYDTGDRPIIHCFPGSIATDDATRQTKLLVWIVERAIDLTGPHVENIIIFGNYANQTRNLAWKAAYAIVSEFQWHYPETLGRAVVNNAPWYLNAFFKVIVPFLEPVTREKLRFEVPVVKEGIVDPDMIMSEWYGGNIGFEYDHDMYYPALVEMCEKRRNEAKEKWKALGGAIGLEEAKFKPGGDERNGTAAPNLS